MIKGESTMNKQIFIVPVCALLLGTTYYAHYFKQQHTTQKATKSVVNFVQSLDNAIYKAQDDLQKTVVKHKHAIHDKNALLSAICVLKAGKSPEQLPQTEELVFNKIKTHLQHINLFGKDQSTELQQLAYRAAQQYLSYAHDHIKLNDSGNPLETIHFMRRGMYYSADNPVEPKKNSWKNLVPTGKKSA